MTNDRARQLRRTMTDAERRLWFLLRSRQLAGFKFRRQHPFGPFILDFACIEHRLVIEADGRQHVDNAYDQRRTAWLESRGWKVIRFWNNDILTNPEAVAIGILDAVGARPPAPSPSQP